MIRKTYNMYMYVTFLILMNYQWHQSMFFQTLIAKLFVEVSLISNHPTSSYGGCMLITGKSKGQDITNVNNYSAMYYDKEMQVDVHS